MAKIYASGSVSSMDINAWIAAQAHFPRIQIYQNPNFKIDYFKDEENRIGKATDTNQDSNIIEYVCLKFKIWDLPIVENGSELIFKIFEGPKWLTSNRSDGGFSDSRINNFFEFDKTDDNYIYCISKEVIDHVVASMEIPPEYYYSFKIKTFLTPHSSIESGYQLFFYLDFFIVPILELDPDSIKISKKLKISDNQGVFRIQPPIPPLPPNFPDGLSFLQVPSCGTRIPGDDDE